MRHELSRRAVQTVIETTDVTAAMYDGHPESANESQKTPPQFLAKHTDGGSTTHRRTQLARTRLRSDRMTHLPGTQRILFVLVLLLLIPVRARAEVVEPPPSEQPADPAAAQPAAAQPAATPADQAREHFMQGLTLARAGDCRGALSELDASFQLVQRPNTLFNMAQCQEQLFRYDLAVRDYERFLAIAPPDDADRPTVEAQLRSLRNLLGTIHVTLTAAPGATVPSNTRAEVWLDDRIVGEAPGDVLVPGGTYAIEVRAQGFLPARRQVQVTARQVAGVEVALEQAQQTIENNTTVNTHVTVERPPLPPAIFWTGTALTVVSLGVGIGSGVSAITSRSQLMQMDPRLPVDTSGIRNAALLADIMYITSGVFLTTTIICAFLTDWSDGAETAPAVTVTPTASILPDGSSSFGLHLEGAF